MPKTIAQIKASASGPIASLQSICDQIKGAGEVAQGNKLQQIIWNLESWQKSGHFD